jgi:hypothetical protein
VIRSKWFRPKLLLSENVVKRKELGVARWRTMPMHGGSVSHDSVGGITIRLYLNSRLIERHVRICSLGVSLRETVEHGQFISGMFLGGNKIILSRL